jgi:hypothetical protein
VSPTISVPGAATAVACSAIAAVTAAVVLTLTTRIRTPATVPGGTVGRL